VLQCVAVCCSEYAESRRSAIARVCSSVLQFLQCVAVLPCVAICCCVAVCCDVFAESHRSAIAQPEEAVCCGVLRYVTLILPRQFKGSVNLQHATNVGLSP